MDFVVDVPATAAASFDAYLDAPSPVIALVGAQELHPALTSRKQAAGDEVHARYLSLPFNTKQLDRTTGTSDDGNSLVLKRDWLHKHTYLAAVVSLWFAWEPDTPIANVVAAIESFRARCRPSCKIVLVLVQRSGAALGGPLASPPVKDDDRLIQLRKAVELDSRSILTLTQVEGTAAGGGEGAAGAAAAGASFDEASCKRVERALLELALAYYSKKAKQLGKAAPPHLVARFHFKRAFYSEVRRDGQAASKHWQACSQALREVLRLCVSPPSEAERSPIPLRELKRIAEFVNRKLTRCAFSSLRAAEACDAFRRHVRLFRPLVTHAPGGHFQAGGQPAGPAALAAAGLIHWGWLCKQYRAFAKALEAAAAVGTASGASSAAARLGAGGVHAQYAECGYYFQAAATCALERRKCAEKLVSLIGDQQQPPPPGGAGGAAGEQQHSPTGGGAGAASAASSTATARSLPVGLQVEGVPAPTLAAELGVGGEVSVAADSGLVIELLTRAYEHFKQSRQLRMILFLATQMAEEYYFAKEYEMAKRFFERVAKTYQKEGWYTILSHIQKCLRVCASHLNLLPEFVNASVALLSARLSAPHEAASTLVALLALVRTAPSPALAALVASSPPDDVARVAAGAAPFPPLAAPISIELDGAQSLLSCAARWSSRAVPLGESAILTLTLTSHLNAPLLASKLKLVASDPLLSLELSEAPADPPPLPNDSAGAHVGRRPSGSNAFAARSAAQAASKPASKPADAAEAAQGPPPASGGGRGAAAASVNTAARPLLVEAGGSLVIRLRYEPKAPGVTTLQAVGVQLGAEPSCLLLSVPVAQASDDAPAHGAAGGAGASGGIGEGGGAAGVVGADYAAGGAAGPQQPPRISVVAPLPDVTLDLAHPPTIFTREATHATLSIATGTDHVGAGTISLTLAPAAAAAMAAAAAAAAAGGELSGFGGAAGGGGGRVGLAAGVYDTPLSPPPGGAVAEAATTPASAGSPSLLSPGFDSPASAAAAATTSPGDASLILAASRNSDRPCVLMMADGSSVTQTIDLPKLAPGKVHSFPLSLCSLSAADVVLTATATYSATAGAPAQTVTSRFALTSAPAIQTHCTYLLDAGQQQRGHLAAGEPVQLLVRARCVAPAPCAIRLYSVELRPGRRGAEEGDEGGGDGTGGGGTGGGGTGGKLLSLADGTPSEVDAGQCLMSEGSEFSALFTVTPTAEAEASAAAGGGGGSSLGSVAVRWSRADQPGSGGDKGASTAAMLSTLLPPLPVRAASLGLSWGLPCEGTLGEVLTLTLRVVNASKELKALRLSYSENDAFLFCGLKLFHFRLPPSFSHTLTFNLVPIRSGAVPLPLPRLLDVNANVELVDPNARHRVFVRPCAPPPAAWAEPRLAPAAKNAASVS